MHYNGDTKLLAHTQIYYDNRKSLLFFKMQQNIFDPISKRKLKITLIAQKRKETSVEER